MRKRAIDDRLRARYTFAPPMGNLSRQCFFWKTNVWQVFW